MSRISGDTGNSVRASARQPSGVDDPESPQAALRRLRLKGEAGEPYADVVRLGSDDLRTAVRQLAPKETHAGEKTPPVTRVRDEPPQSVPWAGR